MRSRSQSPMKILRRSTLVVFINQTNEELCLDAQSLWLQGVWAADMVPPLSILAGESGLWQSESRGAGRGTGGSVSYYIAGSPSKQPVQILWTNPLLNRSCFQGTVRLKEFELKILKGRGMHGTVVFILRMSKSHTCLCLSITRLTSF
jgi:hypothetical protein